MFLTIIVHGIRRKSFQPWPETGAGDICWIHLYRPLTSSERINILHLNMVLHSKFQPNLTDNEPLKPNTTLDMATVLYLSATCVIFIVGSLGNIAVIGAVTVYHKLRLMANVFVVNLAVADLLVSSVVSTLAIIGILTSGSIFRTSSVLCKIFVVICTISWTASINSITLVAVNRYLCICHRRLYLKVFNRKTIEFILASLWLGACSSKFPTVLDSYYETRLLHCSFDTSRLYSEIVFAITFSISCILTAYCYIKIRLYFAKQNVPLSGIRRMTDLYNRSR